MSSESVQPLRINKSTPSASPNKMTSSSLQRPLSEIGSTERRRNSPSFNQATKKMNFTKESSPFETSPFTHSPRLFWQGRDVHSPSRFTSENSLDRDLTPSPNRRNSIENLMKASRVKNSSMFAREQRQEYDPASTPLVERPLAAGRPFGSLGMEGNRKENEGFRGHRRNESQSKIPFLSPTKSPGRLPTTEYTTSSPPSNQTSPSKPSLSSHSRFSYNKLQDPDSSILSDGDDTSKFDLARPLRRHAKSVTFDTAPPEVNEYEMVTPDPSSVASGSREGSYDIYDYDDEDHSFEHGSSIDHDDSFDASLEDTDKTPVVLPEDWRHMSPDAANTSLADTFEDPFDNGNNSPMPSARPGASRHSPFRNDSMNSDGESRPLPPLPGLSPTRERRESSVGLSAAAERASGSQKAITSPPRAAAVSKSDILNMRDSSMSLEDRLRLMGIDDGRDERLSIPSLSPKRSPSKSKKEAEAIQVHEDPAEGEEITALEDFEIPRISRESILRRVKSRNFDNDDSDSESRNTTPERDYAGLADLDPDIPIPSREASSNFDENVPDVPVKKEADNESEVDQYSIPDLYSPERSPSRMDDYDRESSVVRHPMPQQFQDDEESRYSSDQAAEEEGKTNSNSSTEDDGPPTPKPGDFCSTESGRAGSPENKHMSLPEFGSFMTDAEFDSQLRGFMSGSKKGPNSQLAVTIPKLEPSEALQLQSNSPIGQQAYAEQPRTPEEIEDPGTPDSVIRHSVAIEPVERNSPVIPEPVATIKAPGGKLKTRPSITPADSMAMAAARRQVSGERPPPLPQRSPNRLSLSVDPETEIDSGDGKVLRSDSLKKIKLDFPIAEASEDLSFDMDREFDRVVEAQKKGYLMRQNTKLIVASSRQFSDEKPPMPSISETPSSPRKGVRSAGSSPRKASSERAQTWTTEPWNGKARRRSTRINSGSARKPVPGPAPPLPGQESTVTTTGLDAVMEDQSFADVLDEGVERGRLFVKVVGVKDMDLPLPQTEQTWFQLTLDNGLHCVTTSWLELGRSAPVGQEFELVVMNDLEFQLTLQTKLEPPPKPQPVAASPTKSMGHKKTPSAFSRFWSSPKKRKEQELKQQEEAERAARQQQLEIETRRNSQPTAWDLLHDLVGPDGSFARAYVCLKNHEREAFGRPFSVDIPLFNEWAVEDSAAASSVKSKRGGVVRKPPYRVGKLTLQLLYVPKPPEAKEEDMPKSMNACIRELKEAEDFKDRAWEGHLSQQGGDCPYWRRRFFKLSGTKLTAYHETTRQPRATINLAKATKLIDDRSQLTKSSSTKSGGRRKSAFAEEEEGYMFVEEGFRIRFANGEVIDFYADSTDEKDGWMRVLFDTVGKEMGVSRGWTDLVLAKERRERAANAAAVPIAPQLLKAQILKENSKPVPAPPQPSQQPRLQPAQQPRQQPQPSPTRPGRKSVPSSPQKPVGTQKATSPQKVMPANKSMSPRKAAPPPPEKSPRHAPPSPRKNNGVRSQVRSMIF